MAVTAEELQVVLSAKDTAGDVLDGFIDKLGVAGDVALKSGRNMSMGMTAGGVAVLGAGAAAALGLGYSIYQAMEYEQEMAIVSAVSNTTGDKLDKLGDDAMELGQKYGVGATEMAGGLQVLGRAGVESGTQLEVLNNAMKMTALEDMPAEQASESLVNIVKMYGDSLENASRYSDSLMHASMMSTASISGLMEGMKFAGGYAKTFGWNIEQTSAALATLQEQGVDGAMAGNTLRAVFTAFSKESPKTVSGLADIGLTFADLKNAQGQVLPPTELMGKLYSSLTAKYGDMATHSQEWMGTLNDIFTPKMTAQIVKFFTGFDDGASLLKKYEEEMGKGFDSTKAVETAHDTLKFQLEATWVGFNNLAIKVGEGFVPVLKILSGGLNETFNLLNSNQWAVSAIAASLTILTGAALLVAAAWAKNLIVGTVKAGWDIAKGSADALTGSMTALGTAQKSQAAGSVASQTTLDSFGMKADRAKTKSDGLGGSLGRLGNMSKAALLGIGALAIGLGALAYAYIFVEGNEEKWNSSMKYSEDRITALTNRKQRLTDRITELSKQRDIEISKGNDVTYWNTEIERTTSDLTTTTNALADAQARLDFDKGVRTEIEGKFAETRDYGKESQLKQKKELGLISEADYQAGLKDLGGAGAVNQEYLYQQQELQRQYKDTDTYLSNLANNTDAYSLAMKDGTIDMNQYIDAQYNIVSEMDKMQQAINKGDWLGAGFHAFRGGIDIARTKGWEFIGWAKASWGGLNQYYSDSNKQSSDKISATTKGLTDYLGGCWNNTKSAFFNNFWNPLAESWTGLDTLFKEGVDKMWPSFVKWVDDMKNKLNEFLGLQQTIGTPGGGTITTPGVLDLTPGGIIKWAQQTTSQRTSPLTIRPNSYFKTPEGSSEFIFPDLDPENIKKLAREAGAAGSDSRGGTTQINVPQIIVISDDPNTAGDSVLQTFIDLRDRRTVV